MKRPLRRGRRASPLARKLVADGVSSSSSAPTVGVVRETERQHGRTEAAEFVREPPAEWIADVDRRRRAVPVHIRLREEPALGVGVGLEAAVEVEMVLRQVRENERPKACADQALQLRRVRRGLHGAAPVACFDELAEGALQVDRLGRRARDRTPLAADSHLDRPEQTGPTTRGGKNRVEEERRRRLSVGAGHADHLELARRRSEEDVGGECHRQARIRHEELGHGDRERALREQGDRASLDGGCRKVVPVSALSWHAGEERARRDEAGVVGEIRDIDPCRVADLARPDRVGKCLERDGGRFGHRSG